MSLCQFRQFYSCHIFMYVKRGAIAFDTNIADCILVGALSPRNRNNIHMGELYLNLNMGRPWAIQMYCI